MENKPHKSENIHIILWLIKDMSWLMSWKLLGLAMIIPTILVSIIIARNSRNIQEDMWYNIAVCFWISANGTWMVGGILFIGCFYDSFLSYRYKKIFKEIGLIPVSNK